MKNREIELMDIIKEKSQEYYEGRPTISDSHFDALVEELKTINPDNSLLSTVGWGYDPKKNSNSGKKSKHKYLNVKSIDHKPRKIEDIPESIMTASSVRVSAKLDGLSGVAEFVDSKFVRGMTRGDGTIGIDCTDKLRYIIGKSTRGYSCFEPKFTGAIRGEFVISNENWDKMTDLGIAGKDPRNTAAGIMNRNEMTSELDYVDFVVYEVIGHEGLSTAPHYLSTLLTLEESGFKLVPNTVVLPSTIDYEFLKNYYDFCCSYYPCDGVIITSFDNMTRNEIGAIDYDKCAFKFESEVAVVKVIDIDWELTRTGKLVPTVVIEPTDLSGATIRRASGFNAKFIYDNKIGIDAEVMITRSGEVIPHILEVIKPSPQFSMPRECPACDHLLQRVGVSLECLNSECVAKDYRDLQVWVANLGKVEGMGDTLKFKFLEELGITTIEDLYDETYTYDLVGSGSQRDKFRLVLKKLLYDPVESLDALCALNIPRLGESSAKKLISSKSVLSALSGVSVNDMIYTNKELVKEMISLVGDATTASIFKNMRKLLRLSFVSDRMIEVEEKTTSDKELAKVCITGKLSMVRKDFEKLIGDYGYVNANIGKDTKYLITDNPNSGSSKNKTADKLGIQKITEEDFLRLIQQ